MQNSYDAYREHGMTSVSIHDIIFNSLVLRNNPLHCGLILSSGNQSNDKVRNVNKT